MTEKDQQLLWKYIDGDCSTPEKSYVEKRIDQDDAFRFEWQQGLKLTEALSEIEPFQPSLRFVKNVMDCLPEIKTKTIIPPLISHSQIKLFATASIFFIALLIFAAWGNRTFTPQETLLTTTANYVSKGLLEVTMETWSVLAALSAGTLLLALLDKYLKKQLESR